MIVPIVDLVHRGVTYSCSYIPSVNEVRIYIGSSGIFVKVPMNRFADAVTRGVFYAAAKTKITEALNEIVKDVSLLSGDAMSNFFDSIPIVYTK